LRNAEQSPLFATYNSAETGKWSLKIKSFDVEGATTLKKPEDTTV
jgi:hypothetical protein